MRAAPASTASFIAVAMATESSASAIAVFINTPSEPLGSIAIAASDAVPTPASTISGTSVIISRMIRRLVRFWIPSPLPIGAASGITAAAPASISRQRVHQIVVGVRQTPQNPFFRQTRGCASSSSWLSGNSVRWSPITSSFTQFDKPTSRASRAVRMASSAV